MQNEHGKEDKPKGKRSVFMEFMATPNRPSAQRTQPVEQDEDFKVFGTTIKKAIKILRSVD